MQALQDCSLCRSIPTPRKVNGNSRAEGVSKAQSFKGSMTLNWNFWRGGVGFKLKKKTCVIEYRYFLEQHVILKQNFFRK